MVSTFTFDPAPQRHPDGGSVRILQFGATNGDGWGIILTEWTTHRQRHVWEILRWSPVLRSSVRLDVVTTREADARERANAWWLFDQDLGPHPTQAPVAVGSKLED